MGDGGAGRAGLDYGGDSTGHSSSAPAADFVRPQPYRYLGDAAPIVWRGDLARRLASGSGSPEELYATLVGCVHTLLARHTGSSSVCTVAPPRSDGGAATTLHSVVWPDETVSDFLRALRSKIDAAYGQSMPDDGAAGVVVSLAPMHAPDDRLGARDITFRFHVTGDGVRGEIEYNSLLYRAARMEPLARQLVCIVEQAYARPELPLGELRLMDEAEEQRILRGFNYATCPYPSDSTLGELISQQAIRTPSAECAVHGDESLTFSELDRRANRLARALRRFGVGAGSFVAILDYRGLNFVTAMAGIWKAGAAYVPVDPSYPEERVRYMLSNSEASVVIVGRKSMKRLVAVASACADLATLICLDRLDASGEADPGKLGIHPLDADGLLAFADDEPEPLAGPRDPAYMIYTSGSTGVPKGAIVRHDGAINHIYAQAERLGRESISRFLQTAPSSSDISVWQFAAPLVLGGRTVIVDDPSDVEMLVSLMRSHDVGIVELVPVLVKALTDYLAGSPESERRLPALKWMMITGETAPVGVVNAWLSAHPDVPVINAYGPSEAADDVTEAIIAEPLAPNQVTVPIGQPLANLDIYVLDSRLRPCAVGVPGEICVAGVGVGAGYWKQEDKTRAAFVRNPFSGGRGPVIYRTGDIGRWRDDGVLECMGRRDEQVQVRGFRIELAEVESALAAHPDVKDAVAVAVHDTGGAGYLAAYVVTRSGAALDSRQAREFLGRRLASYMVPSMVLTLERLPLTPAGKVDRKSLKPGTPESEAGVGYVAPRDVVEQKLIRVFEKEFGKAGLGIHDDFFQLGGDSLAAITIVLGAREEGLHLRPAEVFRYPTVAQLSRVARRMSAPQREPAATVARPALKGLDPAQRAQLLAAQPAYEDVYPLSPTQQGIYLQALLSPDKSVYVDQYCWTLRGALDVDAYREAWQRVFERHAILRSAFVRKHFRRPLQAVHSKATLVIDVIDWSELPEDEREAKLAAYLQSEWTRGIAMDKPPLMRLSLLKVAPRTHRLVWTHHHLLLDGWSMTLVFREVVACYGALARGKSLPRVASPPYRDYIDWLQQQDVAAAEPFWRDQLAGCVEAPAISFDEPSMPRASYDQVEMLLEQERTEALAAFARSQGLTLTTVLQSAWALAMARCTGGDEAVFGVVVSGRGIALENVESMVGLLVTTVPLRIRMRTSTIADWLRDNQNLASSVREHEHVPLAIIQEWSGGPANRPLFDTLFVMANYPQDEGREDSGLEIEQAEFRTVPAYPITVIAVPGTRLLVRLAYDQRRFTAEAVSSLLAQYRDLLDTITIAPRLPVRALLQRRALAAAAPALSVDAPKAAGVLPAD